MLKPIILANYIINLCNKKYKCGLGSKYKQPITHLYLNKLLYFLNVQYMLKKHTSLLPNHSFHTWAYGPVNPDIWDTYERFGDDRISHICETAADIRTDRNGNVKANMAEYTDDDVPNNVQKSVKQIMPSLLVFSEFGLVKFTHQNPQWRAVWANSKQWSKIDNRNNAIKHTFDDTKDYVYYSNPRHQFWNNGLII